MGNVDTPPFFAPHRPRALVSDFNSEMFASLCWTWLLVGVFVFVSEGRDLTVEQGANATLGCRGSSSAIQLLTWKKPDLQSELYVFFFRDNSPVESFQLPSFKGRVQLKDPQVKDGDFTVILKNVTMKDAGRYECQARYSNQADSTTNTVTLKVVESGPTGAPAGLIVGLIVPALLLLVAAVGFWIYRKSKEQKQDQ